METIFTNEIYCKNNLKDHVAKCELSLVNLVYRSQLLFPYSELRTHSEVKAACIWIYIKKDNR
jgi:hypothetical protein